MKIKLFFLSMLFSGAVFSQTIDLELFAEDFTEPVEITHAGDSRLFVAEQGGLIKILNPDGTTAEAPFLNISNIITTGPERGLLGLAFHPDYINNGYFYVNYTAASPLGDTVIARYTKSSTDPNMADPASAVILMTIDQPFSNHNGGCLRFGPDGYLYASSGDGGSGGDPNDNGQNINSLLGKLLRIDVDNGTPYSSPAGNPFIGVDGADEIWAYGLRNAWKFSFDKTTGDLWIADVGQEIIEEINHVPSTAAGINFGWRCYEGNAVYNNSGCSDPGTYTMPIAQYTHAATNGCSVTGGYVYRGSDYPAMQGKYIFADYCNNRIGMLDSENNITWTSAFGGNFFTTFGEDMNGELYIAGTASGNIYRITDSSAGVSEFNGKSYTVYPNPAHNEVFIDIKNGESPGQAGIYDIRGKLLLQQQINGEAMRIDTSSLQSGMYLLEIESANAKHHHKLVIN